MCQCYGIVDNGKVDRDFIKELQSGHFFFFLLKS